MKLLSALFAATVSFQCHAAACQLVAEVWDTKFFPRRSDAGLFCNKLLVDHGFRDRCIVREHSDNLFESNFRVFQTFVSEADDAAAGRAEVLKSFTDFAVFHRLNIDDLDINLKFSDCE